jgi:hypothetical protein
MDEQSIDVRIERDRYSYVSSSSLHMRPTILAGVFSIHWGARNPSHQDLGRQRTISLLAKLASIVGTNRGRFIKLNKRGSAKSLPALFTAAKRLLAPCSTNIVRFAWPCGQGSLLHAGGRCRVRRCMPARPVSTGCKKTDPADATSIAVIG